MQDNVRTPLDKAVVGIGRLIGADIVAAGEANLSMGLLANSFSSAIYGYVERIGTAGQLAILSDPSLHGIELEAGAVEGRDVASAIAATACKALTEKMRPKMIEMCRHIHKDKTLETFAAIASVLERASRENESSFDHDTLRAAAAFAAAVAEEGLPVDYRARIAVLPEALRAVADRRRDKAFIARMGEPLARIVRLADKASDLVQLAAVDPDGFRTSVDREIEGRRPAGLSMAA